MLRHGMAALTNRFRAAVSNSRFCVAQQAFNYHVKHSDNLRLYFDNLKFDISDAVVFSACLS